MNQVDELIDRDEARKLAGGYSVPTIYRWMSDPRIAFPRPVKVGPAGKGSVRWWRSQVLCWRDARMTSSEGLK